MSRRRRSEPSGLAGAPLGSPGSAASLSYYFFLPPPFFLATFLRATGLRFVAFLPFFARLGFFFAAMVLPSVKKVIEIPALLKTRQS